MGVIMQSFYWDCPRLEAKEFEWWNFLKEKVKSLKDVGFTALWLPPACKAANLGGMSMDMTHMIIMTWERLIKKVLRLPGLVPEGSLKILYMKPTNTICRYMLIWY